MISDLAICREMHWTLEELHDMPVDQYHILIEWLADQWRKARVRG